MSHKKATRVIKGSMHLRMCADLANRTNHAVVIRHGNDGDASPTRQTANVRGGSGAPLRWEIAAGNAIYDAFDLATNCVAAWDRALTDRGLLDT